MSFLGILRMHKVHLQDHDNKEASNSFDKVLHARYTSKQTQLRWKEARALKL